MEKAGLAERLADGDLLEEAGDWRFEVGALSSLSDSWVGLDLSGKIFTLARILV